MIAPVREWTMGREEEIAYAREHGIPLKGGTEAQPVLDRRQPLGPLVRGPGDRGPRARRRRTTSSSSSPGREEAPDEAQRLRSGSRRAARSRSTASALELVELIERAAEIGCRHGVGIVDHIEDRIVGLKVRDLYEVPAAAILLDGAPRAREARLDDPPERVQARARPQVGLPRLRGALARAAAPRPRRVHGLGQRAGHRRGDGRSSSRAPSAVVARSSPYALYDRTLAGFGEAGGEFSQAASPGLHRAVHAPEPDGARVRQRERTGRGNE